MRDTKHLQERLNELAIDIQEMDNTTQEYQETLKEMNDLQSEIDEMFVERYIDLYEREF